MDKQKLIEFYNEESYLNRSDFMETLIVCSTMKDDDFQNLFKLKELDETEFLTILNFLCEKGCYMLLFKVMATCVHRLERKDFSFLDEFEMDEESFKRFEQLRRMFKNFPIS